MVSLFCLARARSSFACSSVYFGVAVGVASALGELMLAFASGPVVFSHAATLSPKAPIAISGISFLFIFILFLFPQNKKRIASFTVSWRFSLRGLQQLRRLFFELFLLSLVTFLRSAPDCLAP